MRWLKQSYAGYVRVRLTGRSPERFFNLCRGSGIMLWNLSCGNKEYWFSMMLPDFYRIRPFVRKAGVKVRVQEKLGLPFFLYRNRKRKLFAAGMASFFLLLFVLSRFIWNISFCGNLYFTDDTLMRQLREIGILYGMPKSGVDCDRIEEELRSRCPRIVWVSAHVSGTRLQIRVRENETAGGIPLREETPRNLVAETAGTVVSILVRAGKAAVQPGDEVEKGQVLVEGMVPVTDDSGEVVRTLFVRADADIRLRTTKTYREQVSRFQRVRSYTGKKRQGVRLRIGSMDILAMLPLTMPDYPAIDKSKILAVIRAESKSLIVRPTRTVQTEKLREFSDRNQFARKKIDSKKRLVVYEFSRISAEAQSEIDEAIKRILERLPESSE